MNPRFIFDSCYDAYREAWAHAYLKGGMKALDASAFKRTTWRPDNKPRIVDFIADFSLAGCEALKREGHASRLIFFRMYCLGQAPWKAACRNVGISEFTGADWLDEIRAIVGKELLARGIYPTKKYFLEPIARHGEGL